MEVVYPAIDEPATPDYVLAVVRDVYRQQCQFDSEADPDVVLSFDSTVADWRGACDLLGWRELGRAYNQYWGIACSDDEWRAVLTPACRRPLAGVCRLIASRATRPRVRPARLFGGSCAPAGAFLTVRSLLHAAGAPAAEIAPSTLLAAYTRRYTGVFLGPVARLAPGALPTVRIHTPLYDGAVWGLLAAGLAVLVGELTKQPVLTIAGVGLFAASYAITWISARCLPPASVEFGDLRTFRDLAVAIASGDPHGVPLAMADAPRSAGR